MIDAISGHNVPTRKSDSLCLCLLCMIAAVMFCIAVIVLYFAATEVSQTHDVLLRVEQILDTEVARVPRTNQEHDGIVMP